MAGLGSVWSAEKGSATAARLYEEEMLATVSDQGDATPASAAGGGPAASIEAVYHREFGRLAALGTMLTGDRTAGEDLAQEVFERALRGDARQPGHLREPAWPWLRLALVRLAGTRRTQLAAELRRLVRLYERPRAEHWPADTADCVAALAALPARMRACAVLFYQEDMSTDEVARTLGCSAKTVENQLARARARLAQALATEEVA